MHRAASLLTSAVCLLVSACGQPEQTPVSAPAPVASVTGPAMWRVTDADTNLYLFGTVHVLPQATQWRTPAVDAAMAGSKAVYFETDVEPDPGAMMALVMQLGMYPPGQKLTDKLSPDQIATLSAACEKLGIPVSQIEPMRPWLAATLISERLITSSGYDPSSGVERTLQPLAAAAGKEIRKLETVEEQLRIFADLPEADQVNYLIEGLKEIDTETTLLKELVDAWAGGDVATIQRIMIDQELAQTPAIYEALLLNRNRKWAEQLTRVMNEETGDIFVAVGAGHLVGKDSVETLLEADFKVERVQ